MTGAGRILIVGGGTLDDALILGMLRRNGYSTVIACDAGMDFFYRNHLQPDLILGDFDSADSGALEYFSVHEGARMERFPAEKDWTDVELAVRNALQSRPERIDMAGVTGSRIDHTLGNLQLLAMGLGYGVPMYIYDAHNRIRLAGGSVSIKKSEQYGDYVSLVPYGGPVAGLTLRGMKYPLDHATLPPGVTLGISNEIADDTAEIEFESGRLLVIESRD